LFFAAKVTKQEFVMPAEEGQLPVMMFTDMVGYGAMAQSFGLPQ